MNIIITPRAHQDNAINNLIYSNNGLLKNDRIKYISACGTGKTLTALLHIYQNKVI